MRNDKLIQRVINEAQTARLAQVTISSIITYITKLPQDKPMFKKDGTLLAKHQKIIQPMLPPRTTLREAFTQDIIELRLSIPYTNDKQTDYIEQSYRINLNDIDSSLQAIKLLTNDIINTDPNQIIAQRIETEQKLQIAKELNATLPHYAKVKIR